MHDGRDPLRAPSGQSSIAAPVAARSGGSGRAVHVHDVVARRGRPRRSRRSGRWRAGSGYRSILAVPHASQGEAIGATMVVRAGAAPFTDQSSAAADLRRPGRHRHREHAAVRRGAGAHRGADRSRSSSRPRRARCWAPSAARSSICSRCSIRSWPLPRTCAMHRWLPSTSSATAACPAGRGMASRRTMVEALGKHRPSDGPRLARRAHAGRRSSRAHPRRRGGRRVRVPRLHARHRGPQHARRAAAARRQTGGPALALPHARGAVHGAADRADGDLRRPGGDRHREHAAVRGGAGAHGAS